MPFTLLDVILIVISLLSATLAMMRGFSREVLSVLSWVCAALAGIYAFFNPAIKGLAQGFITPEWLANLVAVASAFLLTLFIISFLTVRISDMILDSRIGFIDRSLGFAFGLVRGLLIVLIAYMLFSKLIPLEAQPEWVQKARSHALLQSWSDTLYASIPEDTGAQIKHIQEKTKGTMDPLKSLIDSNSVLNTPAPDQKLAPPAATYNPQDKKALDQQIQKIEPKR